MKSILLLVLSSLCLTTALNLSETKNITKRNLSSDVQNYGDPNAGHLYSASTQRNSDSIYALAPKTITLVGLQPVKVIEPKEAAAQQVIYELQQPSFNIYQKPQVQNDNFNVQLRPPPNNLQFQSDHYNAQFRLPPNHPSGIAASETIITPVQHGHVIHHHPQASLSHKIHPLYNVQASFNVQAPPYQVTRKPPIYMNGKLIFEQPNQQPPVPQNIYHSAQQYPANTYPLPKPYMNNLNLPKTTLMPPANLPPITQNRFIPPAKNQMQLIDTPVLLHHDKEKNMKQEEKPVRENQENEEEEEDDDERSNYHEDDTEEEDRPDRYTFEYDEDHSDFRDDEREPNRYEEDDDEEDDNKKGSSRYVTKVKKNPKKKYKTFKTESYYGGKYRIPDEKSEKTGSKSKHRMQYKAFKFYKDFKDPIEAKQSEHIPVVHKKKFIKEKWFVTKSREE